MRSLLPPSGAPETEADDIVRRALRAVRTHLGMEVAYISEIEGDRSVFRYVDAPGREALIKVGDSHSLDDVYGRHILEGRLPQLMPDAAAEPLAADMPITKAVPIGAHMSVPVRLPDGQLYGMLCCLGFRPDKSLNDRDLKMLKVFADLAAYEINRNQEKKRATEERQTRIRRVIDAGGMSILYQPIWNVAAGLPVALEALARFSSRPARPPDVWFAEAAEVGLGVELEVAAIRMAISACACLPRPAYLSVNASPDTILSGRIPEALDGAPLKQIALEVTEHAPVDDYDQLLEALRPLRAQWLRLAVDDAGAGYATLQHILYLRPDLIKLDMTLTRHIDTDTARRALAAALIGFARDTGSRIIAEGVETAPELATLRSLGVEKAQGYFISPPMPLEEAAAPFSAHQEQRLRPVA